MKKVSVNRYTPLSFGLLLLAIDQLTKALVRANLAVGGAWAPWSAIGSFFRFLHWQNTGAAFGIFQNANIPLLVLSLLVVVAIFYYYLRVPQGDRLSLISMALMLGGALGNVVDRIAFGYVTDFVAVGSFPIFNVADAGICVGVALLILSLYLQERKSKDQPNEIAQTPEHKG